jgi:PAS domain S-box-containing protein
MALVVTVALALLASVSAVIGVRQIEADLRRLQEEDFATLGIMHELALQAEVATRHARMILVTGDVRIVSQLARARATAFRTGALLGTRLSREEEKRLLTQAIAVGHEASAEMDRAVEVLRAGDARTAAVQVLERVEPLREKVTDLLARLASEKKADLARRTAALALASDRTMLVTSLLGGAAVLCGVVLAIFLRRAVERGHASELRLRHIFHGAAVAITEEDYSKVGAVLKELRAKGVTDLRSHFAQQPQLLLELIAKVEIRDVNPAMGDLIELKSGEPLRSLRPFFLPETSSVFREALIALWEGRRLFQSETLLKTQSGRRVEALLTLSFPEDLEREPVVATLTDISARKGEERRSREALEQSEARLQAVFDQCPIGITMSDISGRLVYMNPAARTILQPSGDRMGTLSIDAVTPEDRTRIAVWRQDFLNGRTDVKELKFTLQTLTGAPRTLRTQASLLREGDQVRGIVCTMEDITERLRLEEQVRQVQKMEAVGQLAGGVAHDFNNLLTVILNGASLLQAGASKEQAELLEQVETAAERAASLTAQLLAFGRKQVMHLRVVDLNDLVSNHCRMLQRLVGEKVQLDAKLAANGAPAEVDPNLIELLLMNLVVNARDAMPLGGQIVIALESTAKDGEQDGGMLHLSVRDNGTGIDPKHLARVFEPFFTTKAVGKGTGLGLATVYGIIEQHRGRIEVESTPERGTTFHVYLPRAEASMATCTEPLATAPDGHETLLLVEDEAAVRQMVAASLERCGYRVLAAANGDLALALWRAQADQIDLLLTDMVMPGSLSGRELALRLRKDRPELKVVYMSGYGAHDLAGEPWSTLVQKPFQLATLAQILRARLDESEAGTRPKPLLAEASKQRGAFLA